MKKLTMVFFAVSISFSCRSQEFTTFILVRHSEKIDDGTNNPSLNKVGVSRSSDLAALLSRQKIDALYSTPYKRTRQTLQPIADLSKLKVNEYDSDDGLQWLNSLIKQHQGETILISGHSNTIPVFANILVGTEVLVQFEDSDYSNLIFIVAKEVGKGKMIRLKF